MQKNAFLFYTASALNWQHLFKPDKYKEVILSALAFLVQKNAIRVYAYVIMPNHIHIMESFRKFRIQECAAKLYAIYSSKNKI